MSSVSLPLIPSLSNYTFTTTLDNVTYAFTVRWNASDSTSAVGGAWYMDIAAADKTLIRAGIKVVIGCILGGLETNPAYPPGALYVVDLANPNAPLDAGFDDLGARVIVVYTPHADIFGA